MAHVFRERTGEEVQNILNLAPCLLFSAALIAKAQNLVRFLALAVSRHHVKSCDAFYLL